MDEPSQLIRLLVGMARKKVAEQARHHQRQRRDVRRVGDGDVEKGIGAATDETPSRLASGRELLQKFRDLLLDEERRIADLRARGSDWAAVAAELGERPTGAASNSPGRSLGSSTNWGSTRFWIDSLIRRALWRPRKMRSRFPASCCR